MEDNSPQTSTKKSGFSFRKKRSNSKTRKNDEQKPVDIEKNDEINDAEIAKCGEYSGAENGDSPPRKNIDSEAEGGLTANEDEGATLDEDSSPKSVKTEQAAGKEPSKKKTKKRSSRRGLFRRSSKNKDAAEKDAEAHEETKQEEAPSEAEARSDAGKEEQVACDESGERSEVGEQSDAEYVGYVSGAASECEESEETNLDDGKLGKDSVGNETIEEETTAAASGKKKAEQKDGTKKKKFFKRGLSLRRSKSKKNRENDNGGSDAKENKSEQSAAKETNEIGVSTDSRLDLSQFATQGDQASSNGEPPVEIREDNVAEDSEVSGKERAEEIENEEDTKKAPIKPVRKVSFADPERATADDGDSPSDAVTEEKEEELEVSPPSAAEADPSESSAIVLSEPEAETKDPEEPKEAEVEDDELTEVSSVTSSLVASSDAHSQADAQESLPSVFAETEETGSRITLLESVELGERSKVCEETPKDASEGDELLGEKQKEKGEGEWIMLDQSCDVTGELQRMRKQTLFNVKRLCCSVM